MSPCKPLAALALSAATFLSLSGCEVFGPMVYDFRVMNVDHVPHSALDIVTANGFIGAFQEDRQDVAIEVELYGYDAERLDFTTVHANRMGDDSLRIWIDWPGGKRRDGEGAKIEVFLPDAQGITAKTSNGSVTIANLTGKAFISTSNGSIFLDKHQGPIQANTSNGTIRVDDAQGDIHFNTSNGRILISNADGEVQGDTSNGNVYISTRDGAQGPIRVRTSNGRVELDLGHGFEGILRVNTTNGRIKTDGLANTNLIESSDNTLELQIGDSTEISAVRTSNGSVRIHGRSND